MPQQQAPWIEGKYGWNFGEGGWNTGVDEDILKFSFMFDRNVDSVVASLPAAVSGQAHYLTTDNRLYFAVGTTYFSTPTPKWFEFKDRSTGNTYQFNGTSAALIDSPAQLDSRLDAVELTVASLGTAAFEDIAFFATQAELDVVEGVAQTYTDTLRQDLADATDPANGAGLVGRSRVTVQSVQDLLDQTKDGLKSFEVVSYHSGGQIGGGVFVWDATVPTTSHNGGTVLSGTVPWSATIADYLNGIGETSPAGSGCWVRLNNPDIIDAAVFGASLSIDSWASIQAAVDAHGKVLLTEHYGGSKAVVLRQLQELHGVGKESSGYYNTVCLAETLGTVLAPETGGLFSDNYNVSADVIIMAPSDSYAIYNKISNMFIGNYGPSRTPLPQYNLFAPRVRNSEFKQLRTESSSVAGWFTAITFSSVFESVNVINRSASYCWQFGYDGVEANAPVSMTSNTFNSCGANGSLVSSRWYVRNGTYSVFNACFSDGAADTSNAWTFLDPNSITLNACGSENVGGVSIKINSTAVFPGRKSITFVGYNDTVGGNWAANAVEVDGLVDVTFSNIGILGLVSPYIKTTGGCRVEITGNIGFFGSSADSTAPLSIARSSYQSQANATGFNINDGVLFASGVSRFRIKPTFTATVSARNNTGSPAKLYSGVTINTVPAGQLRLATVGAAAFGSVTNQTSVDMSPGDTIGFYQNVVGFDFPEGGVTVVADCNIAL